MSGLDPTLDIYLGELVRRLSAEVGDALAGVWVIGSAAAGGYEPGISDIDVAAAVGRGLSAGEKEALVRTLSHAALPCPARKLELVVYRTCVLAAPDERLDFELNLNTGSGTPDHTSFDISSESPHWFLLDLAMARDASLALAGPALPDLVAPVPVETILTALWTSLEWFEANEPDRASVVLAACRAWRYGEDGRWGTKVEAARWTAGAVADAAPEVREVICRALALRRGADDGPLAEAGVAAVLARARCALSRRG